MVAVWMFRLDQVEVDPRWREAHCAIEDAAKGDVLRVTERCECAYDAHGVTGNIPQFGPVPVVQFVDGRHVVGATHFVPDDLLAAFCTPSPIVRRRKDTAMTGHRNGFGWNLYSRARQLIQHLCVCGLLVSFTTIVTMNS
jgi:hypothetical protein